MAEAKYEAGGRAGTVEFDTYSRSTDGRVWISPGLIVKALLANPEARMAVLAAFGFTESASVFSAPTAESAHPATKSSPSDDNSPGLAALVGAAQEAGRIPGPVLGTYSCPRCGLATPHRHDDPAPNAESGKGRQAFVDFAATVPAPGVTVLAGDPSGEPAPVAEAPERVALAGAEARVVHLEEAAELLRVILLDDAGWICRLRDWRTRDQAIKVDPCLFRIDGCGGPDGAAGRCPGCAAEKDSQGLYTDRDQALSATTAESGKDFVGDGGLMPGDQWRDAIERAIGVEPDPINHTPAWAYERVLAKREIGNGVRDESGPIEPAPVAEAPERVAPDYDKLRSVMTTCAERLVSRPTEQNLDTFLVAMRDVVEALPSVDEHNYLRTQLTDANLKAEGLREENVHLQKATEALADERDVEKELRAESERKLERLLVELETMTRVADGRLQIGCDAIDERDNLKTKLAESERKLGAMQAIAYAARELVNKSLTREGKPSLDELCDADLDPIRDMLNAEPASTEHAGVEAGKAERTVRVVQRTRDEHPGIEADDPTPTETEAPARFRVGQRVKTWRGFAVIDEGAASPGWTWVKLEASGALSCMEEKMLEPADPAPPKPDLTGILFDGLPTCLDDMREQVRELDNDSPTHATSRRLIEFSRSALEFMNMLYEHLKEEREGGGKP